MITQETIQKVKDQASLIEIAGEHTTLKRQGRSYVGLCPFHSENTPSFHVRENGEFYHCFGCGVSGNVITFVMETRGLSFPDAVEDIANRYGIEVKRVGRFEKPTHKSFAEDLYKVNALAQKFFLECLKRGDQTLAQYLKDRKLSADAIKAFGIGFAPNNWDSLSNLLLKHKISEQIQDKSGLVARNSKGKSYDRFRGRLIFPIWLDQRRIVGFGGRLIPDLFSSEDNVKGQPKYINSPETEIYKKSKTLFGLPQASKAIRESRQVYLVEGYMDVVSLWQAGVENVVATCGTAVTEDHIRRLKHLAHRIVVLFDGDSAGREAAAKTYLNTLNSGVDCRAKFLAEGDDPDSIAVRYAGKTKEFLDQLESVDLFDCYLDALLLKFGNSTGESLGASLTGRLASEVSKVIAKVENSIEQTTLVERVASKLKVEMSVFLKMVGKDRDFEKPELLPSKASQEFNNSQVSGQIAAADKLPVVDQEILRAIIADKSLVTLFMNSSIVCNNVTQSTRQFVEALAEIWQKDLESSQKKEMIKDLLLEFGPSWRELWKEAYRILEKSDADMKETFTQCELALSKRSLREQIERLQLEIDQSEDQDHILSLAQEKLVISKRLIGGGG